VTGSDQLFARRRHPLGCRASVFLAVAILTMALFFTGTPEGFSLFP
jgi:hypothetical protein